MFNDLTARCYLFRAHLRKLCDTCRIIDDNQSNRELLVPKKQSTKIVTNDSSTNDSIIEESITDSNDDDDHDCFYISDSDDEDDQKVRAARKLENSQFVLKAGTVISFRPETVMGYENNIMCRIDAVKHDCNTAQYPLVVQGGRLLIDNNVYMRVEGKKYRFRFGDVKLQPGSVVDHTKKIRKNPTFDEHFQNFYEKHNTEESGEQCGNSKNAFIVPRETKITFQQIKDQNHIMKYDNVMDTYSPIDSNQDEEINDSNAPIINNMVSMIFVHRMFCRDKPKSDSSKDQMAFDEERKCTDSIVDTDTFWRFINSPMQRLMISLPCDTYDYYQMYPSDSFNWLKKRIPNPEKIFEYDCIDLTIRYGGHFSRAFILNASKALDRGKRKNIGTCNTTSEKKEDMNHIPSILLCNSIALQGHHSKQSVTKFIITFLNYLRKSMKIENPEFRIPSENSQYVYFTTNQFVVRRLHINPQYDGWTCGFHSLLARQNFLNLLLQNHKFNKEWFTNNKGCPVIDIMKDGKVDDIRNTLLQILTFIAANQK